jgi:hypothetical protein
LASAIGIGRADIKRIIANRDLHPFDFRVTQRIVPVKHVVEFRSLAWDDERGWFARAGKAFHHELLGVAYLPMEALLKDIPPAIVKHFAAEARALDASELQDYTPAKRLILVACLIKQAQMSTQDDLVEMFHW